MRKLSVQLCNYQAGTISAYKIFKLDVMFTSTRFN